MKSHHQAAAFLGILAVYIMAHAGMAGYAVYLANDVLSMGGSADAPYEAELRENYTLMLVLFVILSLISGLAVASSIGFTRRKAWARWLCLGTGALVVGCVVVAILIFGTPWNHYWFEVALVLASCWLAWSPKVRGHAG